MKNWWILAGAAACAACTDSFDPAVPGKQLSIIEAGIGNPLPAGIVVADTVKAGLVTIRYHSFGSSSCNRPDGEDVASDASSVTITAYDIAVPAGTACTSDFGSFPRDVMVSIPAGPVDIRVHGIGLNGAATTLHRQVVALP